MPTHTLSITLKTPGNLPVANATVSVAPEQVNPVASGTVLTTTSGMTDLNGHLELQLLPSNTGRYYILRISVGGQDIIAPFRFQMPSNDTTLTDLIQLAYQNQGDIPQGIAVTVNSPFTASEKAKLAGIAPNATAVDVLDDISDVTIASPTGGDVVTYDDATDMFVNKQPVAPSIPSLDLDDLTDVTVSNPANGDIIAYDLTAQKFVNIPRHQFQLLGSQVVTVLSNLPSGQKLNKSALEGDTVLTGGSTLPAPADARNWQLFVRQANTADNPGLYLSSAQFDIPYTRRNYAVVIPDSNGRYRLDPPAGSASENFENRVGAFSAIVANGVGNVLVAIWFADETTAPTNIWLRGITGSSATGYQLTKGDRPAFIGGRDYVQYAASLGPNAFSNVAGVEQTLRFYLDANATQTFNLKPVAEHHARTWHLQSPVVPDWDTTDPAAASYIRNKPPIPTIPDPNSIGGVVASSSTLPTTSTALTRRGTTSISVYLPTLSAGVITDGYSVSAHTVTISQPHPVKIMGWYVRAVTGSTELCRVFVPLTPPTNYVDLSTLLSTKRVVSHAFMGTYNNINCYVAVQATMGNQAVPAGASTTSYSIESFVAVNQQPASITFPANSKIEVVEAVVG